MNFCVGDFLLCSDLVKILGLRGSELTEILIRSPGMLALMNPNRIQKQLEKLFWLKPLLLLWKYHACLKTEIKSSC